jgi:hypothetical protein
LVRLAWPRKCCSRRVSVPFAAKAYPDTGNGHAPERLAALVVDEHVGRLDPVGGVKDAVAVETVGEFDLKGIRRPVAAYNVLGAESPAA